LAAQRLRLPLGGPVPTDYEFQEWDTHTGSRRAVALSELSELFDEGKDTLFVYSFMFITGPGGDPIGSPCPNCTSIIDAVSGHARHLTQRINVAVSAKASIEHFPAHAHSRGWADIRLVSSGRTRSTATTEPKTSRVGTGQSPLCSCAGTERVHHSGGAQNFSGPRTTTETSRGTSISCGPIGNILDCRPEGRP
jgi:predicted dithiol-disulfide oxidoreductase (DUF899 family)